MAIFQKKLNFRIIKLKNGNLLEKAIMCRTKGKISERILFFLKDDQIRYHRLRDGQESMSLVYFEENFDEIAALELPNIGRYSYYYQHKDDPSLVMYLIVCSTGLTATLIPYQDAQQRIEDIRNL